MAKRLRGIQLEEVRELASRIMDDGVFDFERDASLLTQMIDLLFDDAKKYLLPYLPAVTGHSLVTLITHQMLELDKQFKWDSPGIGEEQEDKLISFFVARRVRKLIKEKLSEISSS